MWPYLIKRLLLMLPTLVGIVLITFVILQFVPGGPVQQMISRLTAHAVSSEGGAAGVSAMDRGRMQQMTAEQVERLNRLYGFDQPVHLQFWNWLKRLFTFDFGESYFHHRTVVELVLEKLPVSISLGG